VLVDTDVVSMIFKQDTRASRLERHLIGAQRAISFVSRAELALWPLRANWGPANRRFERFLKDYVVLPYDDVLCDL
jgi:predicted nucleic acid-binding protein